jgi:hypothetical protein
MLGERLTILGRLAELRRRRAIGRVGRSATQWSDADRAARTALADARAAEHVRAIHLGAHPERAAGGAMASRASRMRAWASWECAAVAAKCQARAAAAQLRLDRARDALRDAERDWDEQRAFAERVSRRARRDARRRADRLEAEVALDAWTAARVYDAP